MKTKFQGRMMPFAVALLLIAGALFSEFREHSIVTAPSGTIHFLRGNQDWSTGPVTLSRIETVSARFGGTEGTPLETYETYSIDDGNGEPIRFSRAQFDETPLSLSYDERNIIIPFINQLGLTTEVFFADRRDRTVRHYLFDGQFIAMTPDARNIVTTDWNDRVLLRNESLAELHATGLPPTEYVKHVGAMSPDGRHAAFFTFSVGYPQTVSLHAYAYSLADNRLIKLGDYQDIGELEWKNDFTVVNAVYRFPGSTVVREEKQTFMLSH
jgi:hypothetical protein